MKISVSLPPVDVEFLDSYARSSGAGSRSAALHAAVELLRSTALGADYASAWDEWESSGEAEAWDAALADGLPASAPR